MFDFNTTSKGVDGPIKLMAGFECAKLHWNSHDLLNTTRHTPDTDMIEHYREAISLGATAARDGLVPNHDPRARLAAAPDIPVVWDLIHFWFPDDPIAHALHSAQALYESGREQDCLITVNEPMSDFISGVSQDEAAKVSVDMMKVIHDEYGFRFWTADPVNDVTDDQFRAMDVIVGSGLVDVVGVNIYRHTILGESVSAILDAVHDRYKLPIVITETGLHHEYVGERTDLPSMRWDWIGYVVDESHRSKADVKAVCWYPWIDMPPWDEPDGVRWACGYPGKYEKSCLTSGQ